MKTNFARLLTERRNPRTKALDSLSIGEIVSVMDGEDMRAVRAVRDQRRKIAAGAKLVEKSIRSGGRLFIVGAGTSGRLAVLEAAECPPTFDTPPDMIQAVMAGGPRAVWASQEGAEDDELDGARQIRVRVEKRDVVVGISAGGVTPFVHGALREAKRCGAGRILITCNRKGIPSGAADVVIAPEVGPEVITGSTRLKAGTATKLVLNRLTVAAMVRLGKVYENLMVDLQPKSEKLRDRACRIIQTITGVERPEAERALLEAGNRAKVAVVMLSRGVDRSEAERLLETADGMLRKALATSSVRSGRGRGRR